MRLSLVAISYVERKGGEPAFELSGHCEDADHTGTVRFSPEGIGSRQVRTVLDLPFTIDGAEYTQ